MEFIDDDTLNKLKLSSKRLKSGKVQVKFQVSGVTQPNQYGYMLAEPKTSLKDVVRQIIDYYNRGLSLSLQKHLYNVGRDHQDADMLIFK